MQEDFLHFIWKYKKFKAIDLKSSTSDTIEIIAFGQHNKNSGPDFFNAKIRIADQLWAGNVEIHLKSSDWYLHGHETDKAYDNVILHVVWEDDTEVFRKDNTPIPTLELRGLVNDSLVNNYQQLILSKSWINCEKDFPNVEDFTLNNWIERLYIERLEQKSTLILEQLERSKNNWESVLFTMLAKNFGLKVNGYSFLSMANSFDFSVLRKTNSKVEDVEALFFGQCHLLQDEIHDDYYQLLKAKYGYLKSKFQVDNNAVVPVQFFRLRPPNFPTIRLSQLAMLYNKQTHLFSRILQYQKKAEFYELFNVTASSYWDTHFTFSKIVKASKKRLTKSFIDLIIINTVIPLKFCYAKAQGQDIESDLFQLIKSLKIESNSLVTSFLDLKPVEKNALSSQGLIQLKLNYCDSNKCLHCAIGNSIIVKNK